MLYLCTKCKNWLLIKRDRINSKEELIRQKYCLNSLGASPSDFRKIYLKTSICIDNSARLFAKWFDALWLKPEATGVIQPDPFVAQRRLFFEASRRGIEEMIKPRVLSARSPVCRRAADPKQTEMLLIFRTIGSGFGLLCTACTGICMLGDRLPHLRVYLCLHCIWANRHAWCTSESFHVSVGAGPGRPWHAALR